MTRIQASESDMIDMFKKHWRCGITKEPLTVGVAYNLFFNCKTPHPVEVLDESAESDSVRKLREGLEEVLKEYEYSCKLMAEANGMENEPQFLQTWDMNNCKHSESGVPVHKDFEHIRKYCQFYEGR